MDVFFASKSRQDCQSLSQDSYSGCDDDDDDDDDGGDDDHDDVQYLGDSFWCPLIITVSEKNNPKKNFDTIFHLYYVYDGIVNPAGEIVSQPKSYV